MVEVLGLSRDTVIETYIGEETAFMDVAAGVDTMLAEDVHTFMYTNEAGCEVTLTVTVEGVPYMLTIAEVQSEADSSMYIDKVVEISGTVSAVATGGFFVQDANAAWSGIWVASDSIVEVGDGVTVQGTVDEVGGVTTITDATVTMGTATLTVEAVPVLPEDITMEKWESVLIVLEGVRANAVDTVSGQWTAYTVDSVTINDWIYASVPVADDYYNVTGIVHVMGTVVYIEPRMEEDVVNISATPINPEVGNTIEFKVYPNPFDDRIIIGNNDKLTRIVVSNIAGQRVMDIEYPGHEIRTANLVSGVYLISLFTEEGIAKTERIVKR
jgi:hypothetical protein